jgi:putative PIG3 family NAD(P)H quinone oxidoreductase
MSGRKNTLSLPRDKTPTKMKAILTREAQTTDGLYIGEWPTPVPAADELLVEVKAFGLNRADILQRQGKYPPPQGASPILGLEIAGTVIETRSDEWPLGSRVMGLLSGGGYAEKAVIHRRMAMLIPENWTFAEAAAIPEAFLTAFQALFLLGGLEAADQANVGKKVLVHAAASGVGTAAIQLAKAAGATVYGTASAGKHAACKALGADEMIDYQNTDFATHLAQATQGRGVDVILDFIGAAYWPGNIESLAIDGHLILLAMLGGHKAEVNIANLLRKRLTVCGSTLRSRSLAYQQQLTQAFAAWALPLLRAGSVVPVIDCTYDWQEIAAAHRRMEQNLNIGKIVMNIGA